MPKTNTALSTATKEYLKSLAQSAYDLKVVIDIHSTEKRAYRKELENYYHLGKNQLLSLLHDSIGEAPFLFKQEILKDDLLTGNCTTKEEIESTQTASRTLARLLLSIKLAREEKDPNFKLQQGLEDGQLKKYLVNLVSEGEKDYPLSLLGIKENLKLQDADGNDKKLVFKDNKGDYYLNEGKGPRLLKIKKSALYYLAFDTVYSLKPSGGTVSFDDFMGVVSLRIKKKLIRKDNKEKCRVIRSYLTDTSNGFLRASKIADARFKAKPLIECDPGTGITFNNER